MKNWMLVCCYERDIEAPRFFKSKDEAVEAMCKDVADYIDFTTEEIMDARLDGVKIDNSTIVGDDYAYSDRHAYCDWKIFNIGGDI